MNKENDNQLGQLSDVSTEFSTKTSVQEEVKMMVRDAYKSIPTSTSTPLMSAGFLLLIATVAIKFTPAIFNEMTGDEFTMMLVVSLILLFGGTGVRVYLYSSTVERSLEAAAQKAVAVDQAREELKNAPNILS